MNILLTVLSTAAALVAVWAAYSCHQLMQLLWESEARVRREASKLNAMSGRVVAVETAVEVQGSSLRKLTGKFYAERREEQLTPSAPLAVGDRIVKACENWERARVDGPASPAAECTCEYCALKRAERVQLRASVRTARLGVPAK